MRAWQGGPRGGGQGAVQCSAVRRGRAHPARAPLPLSSRPCGCTLCAASAAGGHLLEQEPLLLLKWQLGGGVVAALRGALADEAPLGARLSEKGVLQLLFDTRFLADLLAGGLPAGTRCARTWHAGHAHVAAPSRPPTPCLAPSSPPAAPLMWRPARQQAARGGARWAPWRGSCLRG